MSPFVKISTIALLAWAFPSCIPLAKAQSNITNYFDAAYEIYEPRMLQSVVDPKATIHVVEICWYGYQTPSEVQVLTQYLNGTAINSTFNLLSASATWSPGSQTQQQNTSIALKIIPGSTVTTKKLYTLTELGLKGDNRTLFTATLIVPVPVLLCFDIFLSVSIKMSRTLNSTSYAPFPPMMLPRARVCRNCFSYAGILMANHSQTITNCGGRSCTCNDGVLKCTGCKYRRAWHTFNDSAKKKYIAAVNWVNQQTSTSLGTYMGTTTPLNYYDFVNRHRTTPNIHNQCLFLPWHRLYICEYENLLQLYDVCVTVPFWYHPIDSTIGVQFHVLNDAYLGDEVYPYGLLNPTWNVPPTFPAFTRGGNNINSPVANAAAVSALLATPAGNYVSFNSQASGYTHHGNPHVQVGGHMGNINYASADPLFFLHHNMIDRNWQLWRNQGNQAAYDGACSTSASIAPWAITVANVLDESIIMALSTTTYGGKGIFPIGNHCKVCHSPVCTRVIGTQVFQSFCRIDLESILVKKFPISELRVRSSDDWMYRQVLDANKGIDEQSLLRMAENGCNFTMPTLAGDKYSFSNPTVAKAEYCDLIKFPVVTNPLKLASVVESSNGDVCDGSEKTLGHSLLISEETFTKRLANTCANKIPEDFGITDFPSVPFPFEI